MSKSILSEPNITGWYEERIAVRGCYLSLDEIKLFYRELSKINADFGRAIISDLEREKDLSDEEWDARKSFLLRDAFCLTVSINGGKDAKFYGESEEIFSSSDLPQPIKTIFFTNINSWRRNANDTLPRNRIEVFLDFEKPALVDPSPLVSDPTPNNSNVTVTASDMTYYRAVQHLVATCLLSKRTRYEFLHRPFVYDLGMWAIILPTALILFTSFAERMIPLGSKLEPYRWALLAYLTGLALILYRVFVGYTKWAFPVNVLADNKDGAWRHRAAIGGIFLLLVYKCTDVLLNVILM